MSMSMCPSLSTLEIYVDGANDDVRERHSTLAVDNGVVSLNVR